MRDWIASPRASISSSVSSVSSTLDIEFALRERETRTPSSERRCFRALRTSGSVLTSSVSLDKALQLT